MLEILKQHVIILVASMVISVAVCWAYNFIASKFGKTKDLNRVMIDNRKLLGSIKASAVKVRKKKLKEMSAAAKKRK